MNSRPLKRFVKLHLAVVCLLASVGFLCLNLPCQAQPSAEQALFNDPLKQVNWIAGPQTRDIGNFAGINIPQGYRLTDARGARVLLDSLNTPVPDDVFAVLASDSGNWFAVLEYSSKGYVKDADVAQINTTSLLKAVQTQTKTPDNGGAEASLNWDSPPVYDPQTHSLAWALQVQTASAKTLNQAEVLLGRHGFIEVTAVVSYPLSAAPDLKQMVSNISFKDGERYTDYQNGDKIAEIGLAELITGQKPANPAGIFSGGFGGAAAAWVYSGLALLTLGGLIVLRTKNRRHSMRAQVAAAVPAAQPVNAASAAPAAEPLPVLQNGAINGKNGEHNGHSHPKVIPPVRNGAKLHRNRRKRVFDYSKFYTSVVKELSLHSYGTGTMITSGKLGSNGRSNGHTNGYANGHTNGHTNGHANGNGTNGNGSGTKDVIKSEIEQLIATQKNLIEEQKCLLEQQSKLIEEKRWLIQEQTAFLKGQAGLIDEQQFPLKFE